MNLTFVRKELALQFVESSRWHVVGKGKAYRVMVFEPKGMYPLGTRFVPNGFFHADEAIAFSVVHGESWHALDPDAPYSEFDWASPQEMRLLASLIMCEKFNWRYIRLYPVVRYGHYLDRTRIDIGKMETVLEVRRLILERLHSASSAPWETAIGSRIDKPYDLVNPEEYNFARLTDFWKAITPKDYVLLRGVYAMIKADMLSCHSEFFEEAIVSLYIALDASFALVVRKLKQEGINNPSAHDAAVWLHAHFDQPFGLPKPEVTERYFHEFYEQRVMTLHPASRYGDLPYAPIMHDDFSHLRRSLKDVFAYLLTGEHGQDYFESLADFNKQKAKQL